MLQAVFFVSGAGVAFGIFAIVLSIRTSMRIKATATCTGGTACTTHPRPVDTYLRSEAERAWYVTHIGPLPEVTR